MTEIRAIRPGVSAAEMEASDAALPHNIEAEQQLLGAILNNNDIYDRIAAIVSPAHFHEPVHAADLRDRLGQDRQEHARLAGHPEGDDGGRSGPRPNWAVPAYLAKLSGAAMSSYAARDYAQLIYDLHIRRELVDLGQTIAGKAARQDGEAEPKDQIVEAEAALYKLAEAGTATAGSSRS